MQKAATGTPPSVAASLVTCFSVDAASVERAAARTVDHLVDVRHGVRHLLDGVRHLLESGATTESGGSTVSGAKESAMSTTSDGVLSMATAAASSKRR